MTALFLVLLLLLVLVNGLFVAAEFALVRTRKGRIEALAKEGEAGAEQALEQIETIDESLAACQVGITLASIGIGFLGEPAIADLIEPLLGDGTGATVIAFAISFVIATSLHITIGEQVPKMLAIANADRVVRALARPLHYVRGDQRPVHARAQRDLERRSCACSASTRATWARSTPRPTSRRSSRPRRRAARSTPARR